VDVGDAGRDSIVSTSCCVSALQSEIEFISFSFSGVGVDLLRIRGATCRGDNFVIRAAVLLGLTVGEGALILVTKSSKLGRSK
jgi:hypothetical protein